MSAGEPYNDGARNIAFAGGVMQAHGQTGITPTLLTTGCPDV